MTPIRIFDEEHSCLKAYTSGTHRSRSPKETLRDYGRFLPRMGITRLANVTGLDSIGLPVYMAIRPNSRALATSQGKGLDTNSAKASALMESIEAWHAERIDAPLRHESYWALRDTASVVDATKLPLQRGADLRLDVPHTWIEGYDLLRRESSWVPYECVSTNLVHPPHHELTFFQGSNGLASGNHILEAVVHGLCEVIERDAMTLWRLSSDLCRMDPSTVDDPHCAQVLDLLERADVEAVVFDLTSDTRVPAYACTIFDRPDENRWRSLGVYDGFGCHLSPAIALMRALTEAVQSRVTYTSGSRDDIFREDYRQATNEDVRGGIWEEMSQSPPTKTFRCHRDLSTGTFEGDVATLLASLRDTGIDNVVVVDLTKPEIGIPVVKVVVPGLEGPFDPNCCLVGRAEITGDPS